MSLKVQKKKNYHETWFPLSTKDPGLCSDLHRPRQVEAADSRGGRERLQAPVGFSAHSKIIEHTEELQKHCRKVKCKISKKSKKKKKGKKHEIKRKGWILKTTARSTDEEKQNIYTLETLDILYNTVRTSETTTPETRSSEVSAPFRLWVIFFLNEDFVS